MTENVPSIVIKELTRWYFKLSRQIRLRYALPVAGTLSNLGGKQCKGEWIVWHAQYLKGAEHREILLAN